MLPMQPIRQLMDRLFPDLHSFNKTVGGGGWNEIAARVGINKRSLRRLWGEQWIPEEDADRICCGLGYHPSNVFGRDCEVD